MRKLEKYIIKNWFWISAGLILTRIAVEKAYEERGSFQIGGEWFVLPLILMMVYLIPEVTRQVMEVFGKEDEEFAGETVEVRQGMARQRRRHIRQRGR